MKTKKSILDKIAILLLFVLITMASVSFGKEPSSIKDEALNTYKTANGFYTLVSFTGKSVENKTYINWYIKSSLSNYYFVLERSTDGENYSTAAIKKGFASPGNQALQFSFIDSTENISENTYYRIKLHEVGEMDEENKMALLSPNNMFSNCPNASVVVRNKKKIGYSKN